MLTHTSRYQAYNILVCLNVTLPYTVIIPRIHTLHPVTPHFVSTYGYSNLAIHLRIALLPDTMKDPTSRCMTYSHVSQDTRHTSTLQLALYNLPANSCLTSHSQQCRIAHIHQLQGFFCKVDVLRLFIFTDML